MYYTTHRKHTDGFYSNGNIMMAINFGAFVKKFTTMLPLASTGCSRLSPSARPHELVKS
jgi:hypothetical protein